MPSGYARARARARARAHLGSSGYARARARARAGARARARARAHARTRPRPRSLLAAQDARQQREVGFLLLGGWHAGSARQGRFELAAIKPDAVGTAGVNGHPVEIALDHRFAADAAAEDRFAHLRDIDRERLGVAHLIEHVCDHMLLHPHTEAGPATLKLSRTGDLVLEMRAAPRATLLSMPVNHWRIVYAEAEMIHHLDCISMCPRLLKVNERGRLAIHVLAIESERDGLILVDTGYGTEAASNPKKIPGFFRFLARPQFSREATALGRLEALGFSADDVRHIVVTHLDLDHAGGLRDFPNAVVHIHARELEAAQKRQTLPERNRYLPYQIEGVEFAPYAETGDDWFGFEAARTLRGLESDIALVPLFGHSRGHSGVAVKDGQRWLLHAGDAYFHHSELGDPPRGTGALNAFQKLAQIDGATRLANRDRLAALAKEHGRDIEIFCAHDPIELERYAS